MISEYIVTRYTIPKYDYQRVEFTKREYVSYQSMISDIEDVLQNRLSEVAYMIDENPGIRVRVSYKHPRVFRQDDSRFFAMPTDHLQQSPEEWMWIEADLDGSNVMTIRDVFKAPDDVVLVANGFLMFETEEAGIEYILTN